jgi:hypothetical protein
MKMKEKKGIGKKRRRKLRTPHVNPRVAGAMGSLAWSTSAVNPRVAGAMGSLARSTPAAPALSA